MFKLKPGPSLVSSSPQQQQSPPPSPSQQQSNKGTNAGDDTKKRLLFVPCRRKQEHSHKLPFKKRAQHAPSPLMFSSSPIEAESTQQSAQPIEHSSSPPPKPSSPPPPQQIKQPKKEDDGVDEKQNNSDQTSEPVNCVESSPRKPPTKPQKLFTFKLNLTKVKSQANKQPQQPQQQQQQQNKVESVFQKEVIESKEMSLQKQSPENEEEKGNKCEVNPERGNEGEEEEEPAISISSPLWKRYSVLSSEIEETFVLLERVGAELSDLNKDINTTNVNQ